MSGFQWQSKAGRAVVDRLDAWGEKERLEASGGLGLSTGSGGGRRGKPGDMPRALELAVDVDITLAEWGVPLGCDGDANVLKRLLRFIWRDGREEVLSGRSYQLKGGDVEERTAAQISAGEIPGRYVASSDQFTKVSTYDLRKFHGEDLDQVVRWLWPCLTPPVFALRREAWLRSLHDDFGAMLAKRRGLVDLAPKKVEEIYVTPLQSGAENV